MREHGIACVLKWGVALVGVTLLGIAHPVVGPYFIYREYAGGRYSLEAAVMKKAGLWLVINFFCKEAWNKLVISYILCKKNCKNTLEQPCSNL